MVLDDDASLFTDSTASNFGEIGSRKSAYKIKDATNHCRSSLWPLRVLAKEYLTM